MNSPSVPSGNYIDIVVDITNYDPELRYVVNVVRATGEVPIQTYHIPVQDETFTGRINFLKLPAGSYLVGISTYIGFDLYCQTVEELIPAGSPAPTGLSFTNITDASATVNWTEPTSKQPISYEVYVNDELNTVAGCNNIVLTDLLSNTSYTVKLRARYSNFNYSAFISSGFTTSNPPS